MKLTKTYSKRRHIQTFKVKKKNLSLKKNNPKKSKRRESNKLKVRVISKKKRQLIGGASVSVAASDYFETGTHKYKDKIRDVIMIPIGNLQATRRREIGVENTKSLMRRVNSPGFKKRGPLYVKKISADSDQYEVLDGNSSYHASKDNGLPELPVVIFDEEESQQIVSMNKEKALGKLKRSLEESSEKILGALETIEEVFKEELGQNSHLKELIKQSLDTVTMSPDKVTKINGLYKELTDVFNQKKAQDLYDKAHKMEPEITGDLQSIIKEIGNGKNETDKPKLEGTDFKFKSLGRIMDKLGRKAKEGNYKPLRDTLRYTIVIPKESYFCEAAKVLAKLHNRGYTTEDEWLKDTWDNTDAYKGINTSWRKKDKNGREQLFELQIHTPESYQHKENMHDEYQKCQEGDEETCKFINTEFLATMSVPSPALTPAGEHMTSFSFPTTQNTIPNTDTCPRVEGYNPNNYNSNSVFLLLFIFLINVFNHKKKRYLKGGGIDLKSVEKLREHFIKIDTCQGREKAIKELQHVFNNPEYGLKLI